MATVDLFPDFREFFESLNSEKVRYLVIGGYAVIHHGHRRSTDDLDVWIATDVENVERVSRVMRDWGGFSARQVKPSMFRQRDKVFIFGRPPGRIDILTTPSGVDFDKAYSRRRTVVWDGVRVPLLSLTDLLKNKAASGRPKDIADLKALRPTPKSLKRPRKRSRGQ